LFVELSELLVIEAIYRNRDQSPLRQRTKLVPPSLVYSVVYCDGNFMGMFAECILWHPLCTCIELFGTVPLCL